MERPKPTKEEMLEMDRKMTEKNDGLSETIVEYEAARILQDLGLTLEDLQDKVVLDIGSGPSIIEKAAGHRGINTVISLEKKLSRMSKNPDLNRVNADARTIPLSDGSIDLLISHGAPPGIPHNTIGHDSIVTLREFQRVLSEGGEARITPNLAFIIENDQGYQELAKKEKLSDQEKDELSQHIIAIIRQSTHFLLTQGFNVETIKNDKDIKYQKPSFNSYYWKLRKN